jgi:hypothetical protein
MFHLSLQLLLQTTFTQINILVLKLKMSIEMHADYHVKCLFCCLILIKTGMGQQVLFKIINYKYSIVSIQMEGQTERF